MIRNTYETRLETADLHQWLDIKKAEKIGFLFKVGKFRTEKMPNGFKIERGKVGRGLVLPPQITATRVGPGKLEIAIRPNLAGAIVFPVFWLFAMCTVIAHSKLSFRSLTELFLAMLLITFAIGMAAHISVTWPVFDARKWIERELGRQRQTP